MAHQDMKNTKVDAAADRPSVRAQPGATNAGASGPGVSTTTGEGQDQASARAAGTTNDGVTQLGEGVQLVRQTATGGMRIDGPTGSVEMSKQVWQNFQKELKGDLEHTPSGQPKGEREAAKT